MYSLPIAQEWYEPGRPNECQPVQRCHPQQGKLDAQRPLRLNKSCIFHDQLTNNWCCSASQHVSLEYCLFQHLARQEIQDATAQAVEQGSPRLPSCTLQKYPIWSNQCVPPLTVPFCAVLARGDAATAFRPACCRRPCRGDEGSRGLQKTPANTVITAGNHRTLGAARHNSSTAQ